MKHHLIIGGTGRAGTTFLVQYLDGCGLETHISSNPGHDHYDENANAGLEDVPMGEDDYPYVLKSPWLYEYVGRLLARDDIAVDAVILPMRGIVEAAASRTLNELRARCGHGMILDDCTLWETWGTTPGGVVYSLNPLDQARLLAVGFHEVLHALVKKDIPVVLLDFPRFVEDAEYLCTKLRGVLGDKVTRAQALEAHQRLAQLDKVRVGRDLAIGAMAASAHSVAKPTSGPVYPDFNSLDRVALRRELDRSRARSADLERQLAHVKNSLYWRSIQPLRNLLNGVRNGLRRAMAACAQH
jgi:hypothetical protein